MDIYFAPLGSENWLMTETEMSTHGMASFI